MYIITVLFESITSLYECKFLSGSRNKETRPITKVWGGEDLTLNMVKEKRNEITVGTSSDPEERTRNLRFVFGEVEWNTCSHV